MHMSLKLRHFPSELRGLARYCPWFMVAWCMVGGFSVCSAQGDRGGIIGSVIDPTQAAVAKATVIAKSIETGYVRETRTGVDGSFLFYLLEAGR